MTTYKVMKIYDYIGEYFRDIRPVTMDINVHCGTCNEISVTALVMKRFLTRDDDEFTLNKTCNCGLHYELGVKKVDDPSTVALIRTGKGFYLVGWDVSSSSVEWAATDPTKKVFYFKAEFGNYTVKPEGSAQTTVGSRYPLVSYSLPLKRSSEIVSGSGSRSKERRIELKAPVEQQVPDKSESETEVENPSDENADLSDENANLSDENANLSDENTNLSDQSAKGSSQNSDDYTEIHNQSEDEGVEENQENLDDTYEVKCDNIEYDDDDEVAYGPVARVSDARGGGSAGAGNLSFSDVQVPAKGDKGAHLRVRGLKVRIQKIRV